MGSRIQKNLPAIAKLLDLDVGVSGSAKPLRTCVVSSEIMGPTKNGGIGTATGGLVEHLAADGHRVTVLYTQVWEGEPLCTEKTWEYWVKALRIKGIDLTHIPHRGRYADWRQKSWLVKDHLAQQPYDVVYFNEHHGSGYYAMAAKRAGLSPYAEQIHCVITHGSIEWVLNTNDQYIERTSDLEMIGFERRSVEWADVVIGPSDYLLSEYEKYGWALPRRTYCQPYPLLRAPAEFDTDSRTVDEIVFFGRLEARKGLWLFCEAIDRLAERLRGKTVTFMGRITDVAGFASGALIVARSAKWPFRVRLLTRFGPPQALAYLKQPNRLAVMPSLADNSPCVVYECMENAIPFLTTRGSGADELVHPDCWPDVMVHPTVDALAERLAQVLDRGAKLAKPRFDPADNLRTWSAWHAWLSENRSTLGSPAAELPLAPQPGETTDEAVVLLVTIDSGGRELSPLVDNTMRHIEHLGARAGHLVLTTRRGPVKALLSEILDAHASRLGTTALVLDPEEVEQARDIILAADFVIFAGAEHEIRVSFLATALSMLAQRRAAAVSCLVADRLDGSDGLEIAELPCGDIPAVAGLRRPIASGVWAVSVAELRDELATLELVYGDYGELVSAEMLGHAAIHRCILKEKPYQLVPAVGGIRRRDAHAGGQHRHWYRTAVQTARDLGIARTVYPNAAPWFAALAFGAAGDVDIEPLLPGRVMLPEGHPLHAVAKTGVDAGGADELAAALGRGGTAMQIRLGAGADLNAAASLMELARRAVVLRPRIDLLGLLHGGGTRPIGRVPAGASHLGNPVVELMLRSQGRPTSQSVEEFLPSIVGPLTIERAEALPSLMKDIRELGIGAEVQAAALRTLTGLIADAAGAPGAPSQISPAASIADLRDSLVNTALSERQTGPRHVDDASPHGDGSDQDQATADAADRLRIAADFIGMARVYAENMRIEVADGAASLRPEAGEAERSRLVFVDVPLAGHVSVTAELAAAGGTTGSARLIVLDQFTGAVIAQGEAPVEMDEKAEIELKLNGIHGLVCIMIEPHDGGHSRRAGTNLRLSGLTLG
jgi:glycosyltransferase involved in cell wall biosynthesis